MRALGGGPRSALAFYVAIAITVVIACIAIFYISQQPAADAMTVPGVSAPNVTVEEP